MRLILQKRIIGDCVRVVARVLSVPFLQVAAKEELNQNNVLLYEEAFRSVLASHLGVYCILNNISSKPPTVGK